jgi:hypothetical protein
MNDPEDNQVEDERKAGEPEKIVVLGSGIQHIHGEYQFAGRNSDSDLPFTKGTEC